MERFKNKRVLILGVDKTGFALISFFNKLNCEIKVTDLRPIFELNKAVKRLKKVRPVPEMTFGEYRDEDFLDVDIVVYGPDTPSTMPQLEMARMHGKRVYGQFELANLLCKCPIIAVCGSYGRTTVAHMVGYTLRLEGKNIFVGGSTENPFINMWTQGNSENIEYAVVEVSPYELQQFKGCQPLLVVFTNISEKYDDKRFKSYSEYIETQLSIIKNLKQTDNLIVNFDKLANNSFFKSIEGKVYWYSRKSFLKQNVLENVKGTHFHDKRIHNNIDVSMDFRVSKMRIVGPNNRENLLASITTSAALNVSQKSIQTCIEKFPGIPHRLEFVMEKNGVKFYNDSKSENMDDMIESMKAFKNQVILIAGGKDTEQPYEGHGPALKEYVRVLVLVGECKERLNRILGDSSQTYLVGSFEESILIAYQKSRTGDVIVLSPGNISTDIFRDYEERGNYFKKLVYQL